MLYKCWIIHVGMKAFQDMALSVIHSWVVEIPEAAIIIAPEAASVLDNNPVCITNFSVLVNPFLVCRA